MPDKKKIIKALEERISTCSMIGNGFDVMLNWKLADDILALLKEHEIRELTIDEWREWKADSRRNPICMLWENDTSPMWILNPNDVHEPALLMGKLKLFTGKPTFEQCKKVKWE